MQQNIDQNLYSRQLAVYGEAQQKLVQLKIFIYGLQGVGIETAKNLALAGPKAITICDCQKVLASDLGSNFYLTQNDVGKQSRAESSFSQLKDLNPYVELSIVKFQDIKDKLDYFLQFDVVVFTDFYDIDFLVKVNELVRTRKIGFIYASSLGLYGNTFVDFGEEFTCYDVNGEEPKFTIVNGITQEAEGLVTCFEDKRHGFSSGDYVTFREVQGMEEVNGKQFKITAVKSPFSFTIGDTTQFSAYSRQGIVEQVKVPVIYKFKSLAQSLNDPYAPEKNDLEMSDWGKFGYPELLHVATNAIFKFYKENNRLPNVLDQNDENTVAELAKQAINDIKLNGVEKNDERLTDLAKKVSKWARCQISPCASFWGGIIAQEIVKFTGKFSPLRQWLHIDFFEAQNGKGVKTQEGRLHDYNAIFGLEVMEKISKAKVLMVGAGALGCEFIKMFALMGLSSSQGSFLCVTDDDNIETSNLNRQFLFRKKDVGHNKSAVACSVGKKINPDLNVDSKALRIGPDSEVVFNEEYWENLTMVVNAVDNVNARRYADDRCCYFGKPLFESGTLGTKCNSQMILPYKSQSYSESQDPPEESIPLCTLKNFPYQIEHTIQWARDYFQGFFTTGAQEFQKYIENPQEYINKTNAELKDQPGTLKPRLEIVKKLLTIYQNRKYEKCVEIARNMFQDVFYSQILQLLHCFPKDHMSEGGIPFWSGTKRAPVEIQFNVNDPLHIQFIQASANILAKIFDLDYEMNTENVQKQVLSVKVQDFQPQAQNQSQLDEQLIDELTKELSNLKISESKPIQINLQEFEKDDPTNWHIEFMSSLSNLRARNYKINEVDAFKVKLIAGKIIPALATTTALIVGCVAIEIFKYLGDIEFEKVRNTFVNLAIPLFVFTEALPPGKHTDKKFDTIMQGPVKAIPENWTAWDFILVDKRLTVQELMDYFKNTYKVIVSSIMSGNTQIYNNWSQKYKEYLKVEILDVFNQNTKTPLNPGKKYLDLIVSGDYESDDAPTADMPIVKYKIK